MNFSLCFVGTKQNVSESNINKSKINVREVVLDHVVAFLENLVKNSVSVA